MPAAELGRRDACDTMRTGGARLITLCPVLRPGRPAAFPIGVRSGGAALGHRSSVPAWLHAPLWTTEFRLVVVATRRNILTRCLGGRSHLCARRFCQRACLERFPDRRNSLRHRRLGVRPVGYLADARPRSRLPPQWAGVRRICRQTRFVIAAPRSLVHSRGGNRGHSRMVWRIVPAGAARRQAYRSDERQGGWSSTHARMDERVCGSLQGHPRGGNQTRGGADASSRAVARRSQPGTRTGIRGLALSRAAQSAENAQARVNGQRAALRPLLPAARLFRVDTCCAIYTVTRCPKRAGREVT